MTQIIGDLNLTTLKLRNQATPPTVVKGGFYYDSVDNKYYGSIDGTTWTEIGGSGGGGTNFNSVAFTAQTSVTFNHNLGTQPLIQVYDSNGQIIIPLSVDHTTINQVVVTFSIAKTGVILAAGGTGSANQAGWIQTISVSATDWSFTHNLGQKGVAQFFGSDGKEFFPDWSQTINAITATLLTADTGYIVFSAMVGTTNAVVTRTALYSNGNLDQPGTYGLSIFNSTTTNANDSITIKKHDGTSLSSTNRGYVVLPSATPGQLTTFEVTANITILLTGAHWGHGTTGDLVDAILRVLAINDNGTLKWGITYVGNRTTLLTTDSKTTTTTVTSAEYILCTSAVASSSNTSKDVFWFKVNFDDTGGAAEDLWAVQSGIGDLNCGNADGVWQPYNPVLTGVTTITIYVARWTQQGMSIILNFDFGAVSTTTAKTITFPVKSNAGSTTTGLQAIVTKDNSIYEHGGFLSLNANASTHSLYRAGTVTSTWTAANDIRFSLQTGIYEAGPAASFI